MLGHKRYCIFGLVPSLGSATQAAPRKAHMEKNRGLLPTARINLSEPPWKPIHQPQLSLHMTAASEETLSQSLPDMLLPDVWLSEAVGDVCCFMLLSFGVIIYVAIEK